MDIQLGFDMKEDRAKLILSGEAENHVFWLTRRQCIAISKACENSENLIPAPTNMASKAQAQIEPEPVTQLVPKLAELTLRRVPKGLRLILKAEDSLPISLLLKPEDQASLKRNLNQLAFRVQWDLEAAETRMAANQAFDQTLKRLH